MCRGKAAAAAAAAVPGGGNANTAVVICDHTDPQLAHRSRKGTSASTAARQSSGRLANPACRRFMTFNVFTVV